jgi:hypothetical protein
MVKTVQDTPVAAFQGHDSAIGATRTPAVGGQTAMSGVNENDEVVRRTQTMT